MNIRILASMMCGMLSYWALEPESEILIFMLSFEPGAQTVVGLIGAPLVKTPPTQGFQQPIIKE